MRRHWKDREAPALPEKCDEPYHVAIRGAKGSRSAAVTAAAHDVLAGIYPEPGNVAVLDATYYDYLARNGLANDPGLEVDRKVAAAILPLRRNALEPLSARYRKDYEEVKALGALASTVPPGSKPSISNEVP